MSLLFFLKPIWRQMGAIVQAPASKKKRKVYKVTYDRKTAKTEEIDFSGLAKDLLKTEEHTRRRRREEDEAVVLFTDILEAL